MLRGTQVPDHSHHCRFVYGTLTRSGWPSQTIRLQQRVKRDHGGDLYQVLQPLIHNAHRLDMDQVWAVPRSLTTTWGISVDSCSSGY